MRKTSLSRFLAIGAGIVVSGILSGSVSGQVHQNSYRPNGAPAFWHPESNKQEPADVGFRAHTNVIGVILPDISKTPVRPDSLTPKAFSLAGYNFETPGSLACVYGLVVSTTGSGCNPASATTVAQSVSGALAIAIVGAYDNPDIATDLTTFAKQFGLPVPTTSGSNAQFQVVYAAGRKPQADTTGWSLEASLDVEWAHAMSPGAKIYLVEAASNTNSDLLVAVDKANQLVVAAGGGLVSMSWGGSEFNGETSYDSHFQTSNITYLASAGDAPGVLWPSVSANVISVGGTSISRDPVSGNFISEKVWQQTGGGPSAYVLRPTYQNNISSLNNYRGVPDIAADANPNTGVWVYSQYACTYLYKCSSGSYWLPVGGTSAAAPIEAGVLSQRVVRYTAARGALGAIYGGSFGLNDILAGDCGPYDGFVAKTGWDFCTGLGSIFGAQTASAMLKTR